MNFKSQAMKDLNVFHNPGEFAEKMTIYYGSEVLDVNGVLDHEAGKARTVRRDDYAEGINKISAKLYLSQEEVGFIPERGNMIEIDEAGAIRSYQIEESIAEDGEIILILGAFDE